MSKKITKISKENFPAAIKYAYSLNKKMTANILAQNIVLPLGSMLFAIHTFILLLGIAHAIVADNNGSLAILDAFPFIPDYCISVWEQFGLITDLVFFKIVMFFASLYLVPIVACGVVRLILSIFIRGKKPTLEGTAAQQAKQLYLYVEQGPFHNRDSYDAQIIWCRIGGIPVIAGFTAIVSHALYTNLTPNGSALWLHIVLVVIIILEAVLLYLLYARLYFLLTVFIKPYYDSRKKWETFKDEVDRYWLSVDADERKRRKEASKKSYDGWKYKKLEETAYYKSKFNEYYAQYMGQPYETEEDRAKRIVREVEEDLSGGGWGDY